MSNNKTRSITLPDGLRAQLQAIADREVRSFNKQVLLFLAQAVTQKNARRFSTRSVGRPIKNTIGEMVALMKGRILTRKEWATDAMNEGITRTQSYYLINQAISAGRVEVRADGMMTAKAEAAK
jgi:hypothetical protein